MLTTPFRSLPRNTSFIITDPRAGKATVGVMFVRVTIGDIPQASGSAAINARRQVRVADADDYIFVPGDWTVRCGEATVLQKQQGDQ